MTSAISYFASLCIATKNGSGLTHHDHVVYSYNVASSSGMLMCSYKEFAELVTYDMYGM